MPAEMDPQTVSALAQRLSRDPELVLPGSMTRPGAPPVGEEGKQRYVSSLLQHDPGVFLERLGDKLNGTELASFEPLRSDYEVGTAPSLCRLRNTAAAKCCSAAVMPSVDPDLSPRR